MYTRSAAYPGASGPVWLCLPGEEMINASFWQAGLTDVFTSADDMQNL